MADMNSSRRKMLTMAGASIGALIASSGTSAATSSRNIQTGSSHKIDWLHIDDGKFVFDADPDEMNSDLYDEWADVVRSMNNAIADGDVLLVESSNPPADRSQARAKNPRSTLKFRSKPEEINHRRKSRMGGDNRSTQARGDN